MPDRNYTFALNAPAPRLRAATKRALDELGWSYREENEEVVAREDPLGLRCSMAPVKARISFVEHAVQATRIEIEVSVPGFGPVPRRQLADRSRGLEQRIRRWESQLRDQALSDAAAPSRSAASSSA